jgi:hypothetical protein
MDVLCVGMYRACSTWQYEVAAHLVERHRHGRRLGFVLGEHYSDVVASPGASPVWRVMKSHEGHRRFAVAMKSGRAIGIYAHRDLRDVVFSLMHKRSLGFDDLVRQGMLHQIRANDRFWNRQEGLLVQRYEDLVSDPIRGVTELAAHLNITLQPDEPARIAEEYSFEKNKRRAQNLRRQLSKTYGDLDDPRLSQVYDEMTLLHWNHLRDGRVGGWREHATARQREALARLCGDWLVNNGYEADLSWRGEAFSRRPADRARFEADIVRGDIACRLRGLSSEFPRMASMTRRLLRIRNESPAARAARFDPRDREEFEHGENWVSKEADLQGVVASAAPY